MWVLVLITAAFVGISIWGICIWVAVLRDQKEYHRTHQHIFDAHKQIGFPTLTDEQQFEILDTGNTSSVAGLTKYNFVPNGLLRHYINVDHSKYFEHLKGLKLRERMMFDPSNMEEGFFIRQTTKGYDYLFVERKIVSVIESTSTYDKLLNFIAFERLNTYAPENYRFAWFMKYFAFTFR